ncbi:MAG TPA: hypothetical protein VL400_10550 [Polyangiaceae bacterium]|jgi:hypothetical protein|nr:hypothetical protein [Polyangiaceae bacterium]
MSDSPLTIALTPSLGDYFRAPVGEAIRGRDVDASPATEVYLVQLLSDFAKPAGDTTSTLTEPVAFLLRDAMEAAGSERFRKLQALGDGLLYGVGFFGHGVRGVDRKYFLEIGATAYGHAAQMLRTGQGAVSGPDVLDELARKFARFVEVLAYVSDWVLAQSARGQKGLVDLYERWLATGSAVLSNELGQRGVLPMKKSGGIA